MLQVVQELLTATRLPLQRYNETNINPMKKLLPFCFLLLFVTAKSQEQITLKFIRPSISIGKTDKILITIQGNEYSINDGGDLSINVTPDFSTSLRIDCKAQSGLQTNFYLETKPQETYYFQVGMKKTGICIKQVSSEDLAKPQIANQTDADKGKEGWKTNLNVDRKTKGIGFTAEKSNQTESIRDDWMKTGGKVNLSSQLFTLSYLRSDLGDMGIVKSYGYGISLGKNQIRLKVPQFKTGMSSWNSLNIGVGMDMNTYSFKVEASGTKMSLRTVNLAIVGNIGWTLGLGKFRDASSWKGMAFTVKYRPTMQMAITKTEMTMTLPYVGTQTNSSTSNSTSFNPGGFGFDWEFSSFTSTMNRIAPPPKMKFSFFFLPPVKSSPLFITVSLGIVTYGTKGSSKAKRK